MVQELDCALEHYAAIAQAATGRDIAKLPGAGAAGGLGAGLLFFTPARLRPGVGIALESTGFDALVQGADLVLTGEGRTDFQTAMGKAPVGVAAAAKKHGVPVVCLAGGLGDGADDCSRRASTRSCPPCRSRCRSKRRWRAAPNSSRPPLRGRAAW